MYDLTDVKVILMILKNIFDNYLSKCQLGANLMPVTLDHDRSQSSSCQEIPVLKVRYKELYTA